MDQIFCENDILKICLQQINFNKREKLLRKNSIVVEVCIRCFSMTSDTDVQCNEEITFVRFFFFFWSNGNRMFCHTWKTTLTNLANTLIFDQLASNKVSLLIFV